jgi:hypothetical protein
MGFLTSIELYDIVIFFEKRGGDSSAPNRGVVTL